MADDAESWEGGSPWLFLLGLVIFLGSGLLFVADLVRGIPVFRSIGGNAAGAALLILWAAHDTLYNPNSEVSSVAGAAGTALLLYGLYLLASGAVILLTGLVHGQLRLALWYLGFAVVAVGVGITIFPKEALPDGDDEAEEGTESTPAE